MDTRVIEGQKRRKQSWLLSADVPHQMPCWWCALLCVFGFGCNLLKPRPDRQTTEPPPAAINVAQASNQVAALPPPPTATTYTPNGPTPQPLAVRTTINDPPPAPALSPAPRVQTAKSKQNLLAPSAPAKVQTNHPATNSVAKTPTPQTTVTYIPRETAAAIVIRGPPRPPPDPPWSRLAVPLCLGIGLGAGLVALVFSAKRRISVPSVHKSRKDELFLPSEFKLRDSAIQPEVPFGMLAPEKPACPSKMELLVSVIASMTSALRFLVVKFPMERIGTACRALWQRFSASAPAPEQCCSTPLAPAAANSKSVEISATVAPPEKGVQSKPAEGSPPAPSSSPASPAVATLIRT